VGVGPGSPKYVTLRVKEIIQNCDVVVGYKYTLQTIQDLLSGKEVYEITIKNQEEIYQSLKKSLGVRTLVVPFTGDVNFSESEVVDRLIEIFLLYHPYCILNLGHFPTALLYVQFLKYHQMPTQHFFYFLHQT